MVTISTDTLVAQLHRALVDALLLSERHSLNQPVTIAEIYTDLIPYRSVRTLGFAMNADYEHALMQLLAGEGGFARVEPDDVRDQLRQELRSPNPNVGIYRRYAACDVWVTLPEGLDVPEIQPAGVSTPEPIESPAVPVRPVAPVESAQMDAAIQKKDENTTSTVRELAARSAPPAASPPPASVIAPPLPVAGAAATAEPRVPETGNAAGAEPHCLGCERTLPKSRTARFCPFCGADQTIRKCAKCQEVLENGWIFCIACGTPTAH